ncbi:MAG TPA: DUF4249 family protein [Prolixibacteraceae bacterium]|nr:DUF4249 family protein [Prolixibacteraceae bacterium]
MNRSSLNRILLISLLGILCWGCIELFRDEFPAYDAGPVVNAILVEGNPLLLQVSLSGGLDSTVLPFVENADIKLYINGVFTETVNYTSKGVYQADALIEPGKTYECRIKTANHDTIYCFQTIPYPAIIVKVEQLFNAFIDIDGYVYDEIKLTFENDTNKLSYFEIPGFDYDFIDEINIDKVILNEGSTKAIFSNELIKTSLYTISLYSHISQRNEMEIDLRTVTYDYYRYQKQYYMYLNGKYADIMNAAIALPLYSNIENANGIFAGYSVFTFQTQPDDYDE